VRILASCSLGGSGHWQPLLPFLRAAKQRGDEVLVAGPHALSEMVEESGFTFWSCGEPTEQGVALIREQLATAPQRVASILGNRELFGRMATGAMLPELARAFQVWKPDFILREPCEYASAVLSMRHSIPGATVAISLATAEVGSIAIAEPALEAHQIGLTNFVRSHPYLTRFPASLDPDLFANTVRFREPIPQAAETLTDWWAGATTPLVYLTFGTVFGHMSFADDVLRHALNAVEGLDVRVLLTVGRKFDFAQLGPIPSNTHVEPWVDQYDVFASADIVVCHGGSGTTLGALSADLPIVMHPMFADQFVNAELVAKAGAGVVVKSNDPESLRYEICAVLSDSNYKLQAQRIAKEISVMPSHSDTLAKVTTSFAHNTGSAGFDIGPE
jgi:UDP:flavonoid glycosyltransferase YjiC (YdhE family)